MGRAPNPRGRRIGLSRQARRYQTATVRAANVAASLGQADMSDKVNVLLVDDQPEKLLTYEAILHDLEENLVKASSPREALQFLLKNDVAVVLIDVCMPELDGFELAAMIREHPRFCNTPIIFVSAVYLTDFDRLYQEIYTSGVPLGELHEVPASSRTSNDARFHADYSGHCDQNCATTEPPS
jgi:CheY-like chemotaxis protein